LDRYGYPISITTTTTTTTPPGSPPQQRPSTIAPSSAVPALPSYDPTVC
jgi:hypothetical protein